MTARSAQFSWVGQALCLARITHCRTPAFVGTLVLLWKILEAKHWSALNCTYKRFTIDLQQQWRALWTGWSRAGQPTQTWAASIWEPREVAHFESLLSLLSCPKLARSARLWETLAQSQACESSSWRRSCSCGSWNCTRSHFDGPKVKVPPEVTPQAIWLHLANFDPELPHLIQIGAIHLRECLQEPYGHHATRGSNSSSWHLG